MAKKGRSLGGVEFCIPFLCIKISKFFFSETPSRLFRSSESQHHQEDVTQQMDGVDPRPLDSRGPGLCHSVTHALRAVIAATPLSPSPIPSSPLGPVSGVSHRGRTVTQGSKSWATVTLLGICTGPAAVSGGWTHSHSHCTATPPPPCCPASCLSKHAQRSCLDNAKLKSSALS